MVETNGRKMAVKYNNTSAQFLETKKEKKLEHTSIVKYIYIVVNQMAYFLQLSNNSVSSESLYQVHNLTVGIKIVNES